MPLKKEYKCTFCGKPFKRKVWYDKHVCDKKKRFIQANSINSQKAYRLFSHWQRRTGLMRRGKEKTMEEFCKSPYYNSFVHLVEFSNEHYVISAYTYLDWLIEKKVPDYEWCRRARVDEFKADYRRFEVPMEQAKDTVKNIKHWCAQKGYSVKEFFNVVRPGEVLNMVREGRMTQWVLFTYTPALRMVERFDDEAFFTLDEFLNTEHWMNTVEQNQAEVAEIVEYIHGEIGD